MPRDNSQVVGGDQRVACSLAAVSEACKLLQVILPLLRTSFTISGLALFEISHISLLPMLKSAWSSPSQVLVGLNSSFRRILIVEKFCNSLKAGLYFDRFGLCDLLLAPLLLNLATVSLFSGKSGWRRIS